jgi:hypothetical protein
MLLQLILQGEGKHNMALDDAGKSLCNKLYGDYAAVVNPVKLAKDNILSQKNNFLTTIGSLVWSPRQQVSDALGSIRDYAVVPPPIEDSIYTLRSMMQACGYLGLSSPAAAIIGAGQDALRRVDDRVSSLGNSIPELSAAQFANKIDSLLNGLGLPGGNSLADLLRKADQILNCMSSVCASVDSSYGGMVSSMATDLDNIFYDLGLQDSLDTENHGLMDYSKIYEDVGLTADQITQMELTRTEIMNMKKDILSTTGETLTLLQSYVKVGFFNV